jgi:plastocyanin
MKSFSIILSLAVCLFAGSAIADSVTGKLVFDKKPPFAGALYAKGEGSGTNTATLDQSNKVFNKKVFAISNGGKIEFKNSDTFQHNIFADDANSGVQFDVGLMEPNSVTNLDVSWKENSLTRIGCKIHPKMRSYVLNTSSGNVQLFEFDKKVKEYDFDLGEVADDTTEFTLNLPKYDALTFTLGSGESKTIDVTRKGKKRATLTVSR